MKDYSYMTQGIYERSLDHESLLFLILIILGSNINFKLLKTKTKNQLFRVFRLGQGISSFASNNAYLRGL